MPDTPVHPGPDDATAVVRPDLLALRSEVESEENTDEGVEPADAGRFIRTWVWMTLVSGFGLFLVFGSVPAHFWDENAARTYYVPVTRGMQVLDIWRAQVSGLPEVAHQEVLKSVFLLSVFAFIGLSVVALWLATVEIFSTPAAGTSAGVSGGPAKGTTPALASVPIATGG